MAICLKDLNLSILKFDIVDSDTLAAKLTTTEDTMEIFGELLGIIDEQLQSGDSNQSLAAFFRDNTDKTSNEYLTIDSYIQSALGELGIYRIRMLGSTAMSFPQKANEVGDIIGNPETIMPLAIDKYAAVKPVTVPTIPPALNSRGSKEENGNIPGEGASDAEVEIKEYDIDMESDTTSKGRDIGTVLREVLGEQGVYLQDELMDHVRSIVAKHWVDNEITEDGIVGAKPLDTVIENITNHVNKRLYTQFEDAAMAERSENGVVQLVFDAKHLDSIQNGSRRVGPPVEIDTPKGKMIIHKFTNSAVTKVPKSSPSDADLDIELVVVTAAEEGVEVDTAGALGLSEDQIREPKEDSVAIQAKFDTNLLLDGTIDNSTYFDFVFRKHMGIFFDAFYPGLSETYKATHRVGYVSDDSVIGGLDQASKMFATHLSMTPKLHRDSNGNLTLKQVKPYLDTVDLAKVAKILSKIPRDLKSMQAALQAELKSDATDVNTKNILASIYYRFFSDSDHDVTGLDGVVRSFRSYASLEANNRYKGFKSGEDFNEALDKGTRHLETTNRQLQDSVSSLITSMCSAAENIPYIANNGRGYPGSPMTGDVIAATEETVTTTTMSKENDRLYTNSGLLSDAGVTVTKVSNKANDFNISLKTGKSITTFTVRRNMKAGEMGDFPIQLLTAEEIVGSTHTNVPLTTTDLVKLLTKLNYPTSIASARFLQTYSDGVRAESKVDIPADHIQTEFVLANIFMLKAHTKGIEIAGQRPGGILDSLRKYEPAILAALDHENTKLTGSLFGDKSYAKVTVTNKIDDIDYAIKLALGNAGENNFNVNQDSLIVKGKVQRDITTLQTGMKMNGVFKDNSSMTNTEKMNYYVEQAFLERLVSTSFSSAAIPIANMADKSSVPLSIFKAVEYDFMPGAEEGTFNKSILEAAALHSHQSYMRNVEAAMLDQWNRMLSIETGVPVNLKNVRQINDTLIQLQLPYAYIKAKYALNSNVAIAEDYDTKMAILPDGIMQNIELFADDQLAADFIEANRQAFRQNLIDIDYTAIDDKYSIPMKKRFHKMDTKGITEAVFDAYFYNTMILGEEELRLHTGGFMQFVSRQTASKYSTINMSKGGMTTANVKAVRDEALSTVIYKATATTPALTVQDFMAESSPKKSTATAKKKAIMKAAIEEFGDDSDITYMVGTLLNSFGLEGEEALAAQAKLLVFNELNSFNSGKYRDQSKRNSMLGTGIQKPRLVRVGEAGLFLTENSKNIVFEDPTVDLMLHGVPGFTGQDAFDAVQMGHPLYFLKLNNSIGNKESNFLSTGAPSKDITLATDDNGYMRGQKKATFGSFANEFLNMGSGVLGKLFQRMNEAITFEPNNILVPRTGVDGKRISNAPFATNVTAEMFLENGMNVGFVHNTEAEEGEDTIVHISTLMNDPDFFENLDRGVYKTNKDVVQFADMQELWVHFGDQKNDNAWEEVGKIIGDYSGVSENVDLSDAKYPLRDAYIEKAGFRTQEKTGNRKVLPSSAFEDANHSLSDGYDEVSNEHHGIILNAEHDPDTTASYNSTDDHEFHDNRVSLITQIISANTAQGISLAESRRIYNSLGALSDSNLSSIQEDVIADAFDLVLDAESDLTKVDIDDIVLRGEGKEAAREFVEQAYSNYAKKILKKTLATKADAGIAGILIDDANAEHMSFDLKQILPLLQSSLNAEMNRQTVRFKFYGGQYVVAPSHGMVESFNISITNPETGNLEVAAQNLTTTDLNEVLYGPSTEFNENILKENTYKLDTFSPKDYDTHSLVDNVVLEQDIVFANGMSIPAGTYELRQVRRLLTPIYKALNIKTSKDSFVKKALTETDSGVKTRLKSFRNQTSEDTRLRWQSYTNASGQDSMDSDEFKSFQAVARLAKGKSLLNAENSAPLLAFDELRAATPILEDGKTANYAGIDYVVMNGAIVDIATSTIVMQGSELESELLGLLTTEVSNFDLLPPEEQANQIAKAVEQAKSILPKGLAESYYFAREKPAEERYKEKFQDGSTKKVLQRRKNYLSTVWTDAQYAEFEQWYETKLAADPMGTVQLIEAFVGTAAATTTVNKRGVKSTRQNKGYINTFTQKYQRLMADPKNNWSTTPAEFYMPPMHGRAYFIEDGDRMSQIVGRQRQPDINSLIRAGLIGPNATGKDETGKPLQRPSIFDIETNHADFVNAIYQDSGATITDSSMIALAADIKAKIEADPSLQAVLDEYRDRMIDQRASMDAFFGGRVKSHYEATIEDLFKVPTKEGIDVISILRKKRNKFAAGSRKYAMYDDVISALSLSPEADKGTVLRNMLDPEHADYMLGAGKAMKSTIDSTVYSLVNNFTTSLEFITARIPAQGKQSYIAAKTKDFIFSSKNSCYGPLEMLTITGADYDIDKQNMMTYQPDVDGNIVKWARFLDTASGEMSSSKFQNILKKRMAEIDAEYEGTDATRSDIKNAKRVARKFLEDEFQAATKNYVVYNLLQTIKDPKNAIEAATPVEMSKPKNAMKKPVVSGVFTAKNLGSAMVLPGHALPFNPYTMAEYEKVNMDGKIAVGMYASGLKSYLATYYAWISADKDKPFELNAIKLKSALATDIVTKNKDIHEDALQFIHSDGRIQNIKGLADTENYLLGKHGTDSLTEKAVRAKNSMEDLDPNDEEYSSNQAAIIEEFMDSEGEFYENMTSDAAWADLSALLSAATDNAKELVLGKIGANGTTNSYIATMVKMGVDLTAALELINHPHIAALVKKVEDSGDLIKTKKKFKEDGEIVGERFTKLLEKAAKSEEDKVNGAFSRLLPFVKIADEFTLVAKMLSINQGLVNSAYATFNFVLAIENGINDVLEIGNNKAGNKKKLVFKLQKFIDNVSSDSGDYKEIIAAFSKYNTAINVPYVLMKNSHYFGQFKGLFMAKGIRDSISSVYKVTEELIKGEMDKDNNKLNITESDFNKVADYIHGIGVQRFFEAEPVGKFNVGGHKFDLSKPTNPLVDGNNVGGRKEFLELMPVIIRNAQKGAAANNPFIMGLSTAEGVIDYATQKAVTVVRTRDLSNMRTEERTKLQLGLDSLSGTPLYKALFAYNLMVNKGSFAKGSYMTLFKEDIYMGYSAFVKANMESIILAAKAEDDESLSFLLNNQALIPSVSMSAAAVKKMKESITGGGGGSNIPIDGEMFFDEHDDGGASMEDVDMFTRSANVIKHTTDTTGINMVKRQLMSTKPSKEGDILKARQNGIVYVYNADLKTYTPIAQDIPSAAIPSNNSSEISPDALANSGFGEGFKIETESGQNIRIVAFVNDDLKMNLPATAGKSGAIVGYDKLHDSGQHYLIRHDNKAYQIISKDDLLKKAKNGVGAEKLTEEEVEADTTLDTAKEWYRILENGVVRVIDGDKFSTMDTGATLILEGPTFSIKHTTGATEITKREVAVYANPDGTTSTTSEDGGSRLDILTIGATVDSHTTLNGASKALAKGIHTGTSKVAVKTIEELEEIHVGMRDIIFDALDKEHTVMSNNTTRMPAGLVEEIQRDIKLSFPSDVSHTEMILNLLNKEGLLRDILAKRTTNFNKDVEEKVLAAMKKHIKNERLRAITKNLFAKDEEMRITSLGTVEHIYQFLADTKSGMKPFTDYVHEKHLENGLIDAYEGINSSIIVAKAILESKEDNVQESKPISVPEHLQIESSNQVSQAVLTRVIRTLNKTFPEVNISSYSTDEIKKRFGPKHANAKGFVVNGEVIINTDNATLETPLHEFMHIYLNHLKIDDNAVYASVMQKALDHSFSDKIRDTYGKISENDVAQETFVQLMALKMQGKLLDSTEVDNMTQQLDGPKGILGKITSFFSSLFNTVFNTKKGDKIEFNLNNSLMEIMDQLGDKVIYGKGSILNTFDKSTRNLMKMANANSELDIKEAKKILESKGFIQKFCI